MLRVLERSWLDPLRVFRAAEGLPGRVWLDSGGALTDASRWSALAVRPVESVTMSVGEGLVAEAPAIRSDPFRRLMVEPPAARSDPFRRLGALHRRWRARAGLRHHGRRETGCVSSTSESLGADRWEIESRDSNGVRRPLGVPGVAGESSPREAFGGRLAGSSESSGARAPFTGGVIALLGYDLARMLERVPSHAADDPALPDLWAAVYDGVILFDRLERRLFLTSWGVSPEDGLGPLQALLEDAARGSEETGEGEGGEAGEAGEVSESGADHPGPGGAEDVDDQRSRFLAGVAAIKREIERGEIYQANLTRRIVLSVPDGQSGPIYERLRRRSPTPFGAYVDAGSFHLLSSSPERFLRIAAGCVETRPIKGTRPRGRTPAEDEALRRQLLSSPKDRAELLMIVDLERNDLGRVCETSSVEVSGFPTAEGYSTVWHLVAAVRGRIRPGVTPAGVVRAAFPGGSITGAPKLRAMEILERQEPDRRKFSMGSLLAWDFGDHLDSSILIRTMVIRGGEAVLNVGSGIVADSCAEEEYLETVAKAAPLLAALAVR